MPRVNQRIKQSLNDTVSSVNIIYFLCSYPNFMCDYAQTSACSGVAPSQKVPCMLTPDPRKWVA